MKMKQIPCFHQEYWKSDWDPKEIFAMIRKLAQDGKYVTAKPKG